MLLNHEYDRKIRVGYIGSGEMSFRNILPCFHYTPIDLVAMADHNTDRGLAVARQFGARHFYPNHQAMLAKEKMDAVFIVVGVDAEGQPRCTALADDVLRAGFHAWVAPPPCSSSKDIQVFTEACMKAHKFVMTGYKRMFAPAYVKVAELTKDRRFGASSFYFRYPLAMPPKSAREDGAARSAFLEFLHPYSVLMKLFGESDGFSILRGDAGGVMMNLHYRSGVVGTLHLAAGLASSSPIEFLEVIGKGANITVENGIRITHYRADNAPRDDGQPGTYIGSEDSGPIVWEPEFTLGRLHSNHLALQGWLGCVEHFAERLLAESAPTHGNLVDMLHMMTVFDKVWTLDERKWSTPY